MSEKEVGAPTAAAMSCGRLTVPGAAPQASEETPAPAAT